MATTSKPAAKPGDNPVKQLTNSIPWHKVAVKAVSLPGYGSIFTAWVSLLGMFTLSLYTAILDTDVSGKKEKIIATHVSIVDLFVGVFLSLLFWAIVAHLSGIAIRWLVNRFKVKTQDILAVKLALMAGGWLLFTLLLAVLVPEHDYLAYIFGGFMIALGGISFAAEEILLKLWRLKPTDSW